jgi:hypothetical protein
MQNLTPLCFRIEAFGVSFNANLYRALDIYFNKIRNFRSGLLARGSIRRNCRCFGDASNSGY